MKYIFALSVILLHLLIPGCFGDVRSPSPPQYLWSHTYGGPHADGGWSIERTSDGGYVIIGYTTENDTDLWILKLNGSGEIEWSRVYGGPGDDIGYGIDETRDGGFIAVGTTDSFGTGGERLWLLRLNRTGDLLWEKALGGFILAGGDAGWSVKDTGDGFVIVGSTRSFGSGGKDLWLVKTDRTGDVLWSRSFGRAEDDGGFSVECLPPNYVASGYTTESGNENAYIVMVNPIGYEVWNRSLGGSGDDAALSMCLDGTDIVVTGRTDTGKGDKDILLAKVTSQGDLLWWRSFGGDGDQVGMAVVPWNDGYLVAGRCNSDSEWKMILVGTDSNGVPLSYHKMNRGIATSLVTNENGCVVIGITSKPLEQEDLFVASLIMPNPPFGGLIPSEARENTSSQISSTAPPARTTASDIPSDLKTMFNAKKRKIGSKNINEVFKL